MDALATRPASVARRSKANAKRRGAIQGLDRPLGRESSCSAFISVMKLENLVVSIALGTSNGTTTLNVSALALESTAFFVVSFRYPSHC